MYDAMVVGAGPVGSYLAYRLARQGHRVIVFERRQEVGDQVCCTGIVGKECFDSFPVSDTIIATEASSCKFFSPSGSLIRLREETFHAYVIDRPAFDCALAQKAQEAGVDYFLSTRVDDIALVDHRVRVGVEQKGRVRDIDGKVVIISNGFGFSLPRKLGLGQVGDFVWGAQAEVGRVGVDEIEVYLGHDVAPGFFAWLVPISASRGLVGLLSRRKPGAYLEKLLSRLYLEGKIASEKARITYGGIPIRPLTKTYGERIVVVGDAAGQVKPTTCGGIYYGLLCADIAADTVHDAISDGDLSARRLSIYEKGWKDVLARELRIGYWARRLYERLGDRRVDHLFELIQSNNVHETLLQSPDFSFDWHGGTISKAVRHKALRQVIWSATKSLFPF